MADPRAELRRTLSVVEGPLRVAQKTDRALLALSNLGELITRAATEAKKLPLEKPDHEALDRIVLAAHAFDTQGLDARRKVVAEIASELAQLGTAEPSPAPAQLE